MWKAETHEDICPSCGELLTHNRDGVTLSHRAGSTCPLLPVVTTSDGWAGIAAAILQAEQMVVKSERTKREKG